MNCRAPVAGLLLAFVLVRIASAEVVRIDIQKRIDEGRDQRLIGRVYFAVDPLLPANRAIADLLLAPRNGAGLVEFSSALLVVRLKDARRANGTVFFEIVNRGRDQSLGLMSGARSPSASPEAWDLGDRFMVDQGFTMAFLGWQFDVAPGQGLGLQAPSAPVQGLVRASVVEGGTARQTRAFSLYVLRVRGLRARTAAHVPVADRRAGRGGAAQRWRFGPNGCSVQVETGLEPGLYEPPTKRTDRLSLVSAWRRCGILLRT